MDKDNRQLVETITRLVVETLENVNPCVPIGVTNRHCHLSREDRDVLFGKGSELTWKKDLGQPGQYAAEEVVSVQGAKGRIDRVRVLGPLRGQTQVEISVSDGFTLGVTPPVRESGKLDATPGIEVIGPRGSVMIDCGIIAAQRHIHMPPETAALFGIADKELVCVEVGDPKARGAVLQNVLVRVSDQYALEMHLDLDEANGLGVRNGDCARLLK